MCLINRLTVTMLIFLFLLCIPSATGCKVQHTNSSIDLPLYNDNIFFDLNTWGSWIFSYNNMNHLYEEYFAIRYSTGKEEVFKWSDELKVKKPIAYKSIGRHVTIAYGEVSDGNIEVDIYGVIRKNSKWVAVIYSIKDVGKKPVKVAFYQGADFDVDDDCSNDIGGYIKSINLLYEKDVNYVGIASPVKPNRYDVCDYYEMWNRIEDDSLKNRNSYDGDVGVAFKWDIGTLRPHESKTIPVVFVAGSNLDELKTQTKQALKFVAFKGFIKKLRIKYPQINKEYLI